MSQAVVEAENLSFRYGEVPVLEDVSLTIHEDDFLAVIGPNGGGKTTLIKLILGLLQPASGRVRVFGAAPEKTRRHIGYIPQYAQFEQNFPVTVEQVALMGRLGHTPMGRRYRDDDREEARRALERVDMAHLAKRQIGGLSGGERQRMLAARALASDPRMLVMDEPTASVDSRVEENFYELLRDLNRDIPIVLVSHDLGFVSAYVNRVACLNRRLVVSSAENVQAQDLEAMYGAPVKMWSHSCEL